MIFFFSLGSSTIEQVVIENSNESTHMLEYELDDCDYGDESEDEKQLKSNYFYIKNQI
jgi:hypothetical protein